MPVYVPKRVAELLDLIAYTSLYAPDEFPKEDGVGFQDISAALEEGLVNSAQEIANEAIVAKARATLSEALSAYQAGDLKRGGGLINAVEGLLRRRDKRSR